jgi:hypothetical protein
VAARSTMLLALTMAIAAVAAGCGSGGGDSSSSEASSSTAAGSSLKTSSLSKAEFVKKANAICVHERGDILAKFDAYFKQHKGEKGTEEVFADMIHVVLLPSIERDIAKIRALGAPEGDEASVELFLAEQQKAIETVAKAKRISEEEPLSRYFEAPSKLARAYGLEGCTQS